MKRLSILCIFLLAAAVAFADGTIDINSPTGDPANGWTWSSPTLTITADGTYTITGNGETTNRIEVQSGLTAVNIILSGVNINVSQESGICAFDMTGATVQLTLDGINTLISGESRAGLEAPSGATLVIDGTGSLTAIGSYSVGGGSAGIGGGSEGAGGTITVNGGTVTATGCDWGAGIGGGHNGAGGTITITGGTVTANGGAGSAGIGGGAFAAGGIITITGGTVTATSLGFGAGIGGGSNGAGGTIAINGGTVTATGGGALIAGIGCGYSGEYDFGTLAMNGNAFVNASSVSDVSPKTKGILFAGNTGTMYGDVTLSLEATIPAGKTLTVSAVQTLTNNGTVINGGTITNNGTIDNCNGTLINNGTIDGTGTITCGFTHPDANHTVYIRKGSIGDGSSWANAYPELAVALLEAQTNADIHEIRVAAGTYKPLFVAGDGTTDRDKAFVLVEGVKIYGGFQSPLPTEGGAVPALGTSGRNGISVLSGDIDGDNTSSGNAYHAVIGAAIADDGETVLDGFTVTGGNANGASASFITVNGINIFRNFGGGIYNDASSPTLANVTVNVNAAHTGGGIYNNDHSSPSITNATVSGNTATSKGGGLSVNDYSSPTLTNVTVSGNSASFVGGGIQDNDSSPVLVNVTVIGNKSTTGGGGIYTENPMPGVPPVFVNVTVSGNTSNYGGGIYFSYSSPRIYNSVIWGNTAATINYPNVYNDGTPVYKNSLVSGSGGSGSWNTADYGTDGGNNIDCSPMFADWKDPATVTMPNTGGDYRLQLSSLAIDAGDNTDYAGGVTALATATDLAGNPRLFGANIDLGAYETAFYMATFRFGAPRPDSITGVVSPYVLTEPSPAPDSTDYTFGGWYTSSALTTPFDFDGTLTQDTALYAKWRATVIFDANIGNFYADTVVDLNETVTGWAHVPTFAGRSFGGWFTDNNTFADEWDIDATQVTRDTTLYAKWVVTVTFDAKGGNISPADTTVTLGQTVNGWAHDPTLADCTFTGWYTDDSTFANEWDIDATPVTQDTTLYARWEVQVTFDPNGGDVTTPADTTVVLNRTVIGWAHVPTRSGSSFGGWFTDNITFADQWDIDATPVTQDTTLYAKWVVTVIFDPNGGNAMTPADTTVNLGENVGGWTHVPVRYGYAFDGWFTDTVTFADEWDIDATAATQDTTIYAKWDVNNYTVTYLLDPGVVYETQTAPYNTLLTEPSPAPDSTDYAFDGWYADAACTTVWDFTADVIISDTTLHAKWTHLSRQITFSDPHSTEGLDSIVITSPLSSYTVVSDTDYAVSYGSDFSFRLEYDYPYTDAASTVTVNGTRIYPDDYGIYTLQNVQVATAIDIVPGIGFLPPIVRRPVDILPAAGVTMAVDEGDALVPGPGRFYARVGGDFVFIANYNGSSPLKVMSIGYYSGDSIEVIGHDLRDGTYRYVLEGVIEPWTITFGPDLASETTGNEVINNASVRAFGNTLYITSAVVGEARIYSVAGVLVKIQPFIAGTTTQTTLAKGLYFVVINGKSWKIVIS
jgi:uncharacterized repeat protein (TIGR02543 family)